MNAKDSDKKRKGNICWACSMNRCGQGPYDNTCTCCRNNHQR